VLLFLVDKRVLQDLAGDDDDVAIHLSTCFGFTKSTHLYDIPHTFLMLGCIWGLQDLAGGRRRDDGRMTPTVPS